jgi:hypothetical protein
VGIILGLGAATILDLLIVRFLMAGRVDPVHVAVVKFCSGLVTLGLIILWISGSAYLLHYWAFDPGLIGNPKVWSKIVIVGVLTINGVFIHSRVLPIVAAQQGRSLFEGLATGQKRMLLFFGTVSATSWYVPLLLGAMPQLNFVVPATSILAAYTLLLLFGLTATQGIANWIWNREAERAGQLRQQHRQLQRIAAVMRSKDKTIATKRQLANKEEPKVA